MFASPSFQPNKDSYRTYFVNLISWLKIGPKKLLRRPFKKTFLVSFQTTKHILLVIYYSSEYKE